MLKMNDSTKERLLSEYKELKTKLQKLKAFLEKNNSTDDIDIRLLMKQRNVMQEYVDILEVRLRLDSAKKTQNK